MSHRSNLAAPLRIVLTGASGQLGCLAGRAFDKMPGTTWVGLDRNDGANVQKVELTDPLDRWVHHLRGADVIVHLAGASSLNTKDAVARRLIDDLSKNVMAAADAVGVTRIVFASSCEVLGGLAGGTGPLSGETPACPINAYAAAKARVEDAGQSWASVPGRSFMALRIGMYLPHGRPGPRNSLSIWKQQLWLDGMDWQQAIARACKVKVEGYCPLVIVSKNAGMRWKLSPARRVLGYDPEATYQPREPIVRPPGGVLSGFRERLYGHENTQFPSLGAK